jgi:predicted P-loop ATPase
MADRDQLFAEAVTLYRAGHRWWPDAQFERCVIAPEQDARYEPDAWEEVITTFLIGRTRTTVLEIARDALSLTTDRLGTPDQRRITAALRRLGWGEQRTKRERWWAPPASEVTG